MRRETVARRFMHAPSLPEVTQWAYADNFADGGEPATPRKVRSLRRAPGGQVMTNRETSTWTRPNLCGAQRAGSLASSDGLPRVLDIAVANSSSGSVEGESGESNPGDGDTDIPRTDRTKKIRADADRRDDEAAARDIAADERAEAADLQAFLDIGEDYAGHGERRAAALDRAHSKGDREKSADDRAQLSEESDTDAEGTVS